MTPPRDFHSILLIDLTNLVNKPGLFLCDLATFVSQSERAVASP